MKQLYNPLTLHQIFSRSQFTIFLLTFTICSAIFLAISTYTMNAYAKSSINILTSALNERIQPAVVFNDKLTLKQILDEYSTEFPIRSIIVTSADHQVLAQSEQQGLKRFSSQTFLDFLFFRQPIKQSIDHNNKHYGDLELYGNSSELVLFFHKIIFAMICGFIMLSAAAYWSVNSVYQYLMQSIRSIVESAQTISVKKNYNMRVSSSNIQELQALSTAFNGLLSEIEQSNKNLQRENSALSHQSKHDALTQLPNRSYFYEELFKLFDHPLQKNATVLFLDIVDFQVINVQFGHLAGDAVLRASSFCVRQALPEDAFFSRLGSDEFAIILPNNSSRENIEQLCQNIHTCFASTFIYEQHPISLQIRMGAACTNSAKNPEDLIAFADHAMRKAKELNKKWYIYTKLENS